RSGVRLTVDGEDVALTVEGDAAHLERALVNLIANAIKFTPADGRASVTVEESAGADEVVIRVSDTGIGVPAADIPQLFSRFFRASNVQKAAIPGVGLGLSISQHI